MISASNGFCEARVHCVVLDGEGMDSLGVINGGEADGYAGIIVDWGYKR